MSVNKVILVGNVGADPEIRALENGTKFARFNLATNETYVDKQGQRQTQTEWHRIIVWGKQAEVIEQYVKAGKLLYVEGRLRSSSYEKDGIKRYSTDIHCDTFKFLGSNPGQQQQGGIANEKSQQQSVDTVAAQIPEPDDLPF